MKSRTTSRVQLFGQLHRIGLSLELIAIFVVLVCIEWAGWFAPVRAVSERIALPLVSRIAAGIRSVQEPVFILINRGVRLSEFRILQQQYAEALVKISELEGVAAENLALREALDARSKDTSERVLAFPVLTADGTYIGAGTEDGIHTGAVVLADGVLAGFIREQTAHQSRVYPLHQISVDQPILVKTDRGATGLVYGDGKSIVLREVSRDNELVHGDRVVTSGQEGVRAGLLVGTIRLIDDRPSAPTLGAVVDQPVSLYEVALVEVW